MPLSVETAVVTKKGALRDFNTDSVNAVGKIWPAEITDGEKGLRVVGSCADRPYYVLSSSETKGTAQSATDLFANCVAKFKADGSNCTLLLADYLKAFAHVLTESGFHSADFGFGAMAGFNDTVYVAKTRDTAVYTFYDNTFTEITPRMTSFADGASSYGIAQCNHVAPGDLFMMLPARVVSVFPAGLLHAICVKAEGDVKKVAALIASQAAKYGCTGAVSAIVMKITGVTPAAGTTAPAAAAAAAAAAPASAEEPPVNVDNVAQAIEDIIQERNTTLPPEAPAAPAAPAEEPPKKSGRRAVVIVLTVLLAIGLLVALFFAVRALSKGGSDPTGAESTSETDTSSTEASTDETSSEADSTEQDSSDTEASESESETETTALAPAVPSTTEATRTYYYTPTQAPETTEAPATDETPATEDTTEEPSAEPTEDTEATDPTEDTEATEPTDDTEATEPSEDTEATEPTDDTEATEPTGDTEATEPTGDTEATEPSEDTEATEPAEDTDAAEPVEDTDATEDAGAEDTEAADAENTDAEAPAAEEDATADENA